jgi:methylenetetrahydrofolate reductase (NADPH)
MSESKSAGGLEAKLRAGRFVLTAEMTPPDAASEQAVVDRIRPLVGLADAVNVTDGAGARAHMSALAAAAILARHGVEPILQFTVRDRNRLAIAGDLIGAAALGIANILCLHGDAIEKGDQPDAKPVIDLDSRAMMSLARRLRDEGKLPSGRAVDPPPRLFIGAADTPKDPEPGFRPDGIEAKIAAGADFFQTQFVFDLEAFARYMAALREHGVTGRAFVIAGVGPIASARSARWMNENLFGVHVPEAVIRRLEGAQDQAAEGRRIAVELIAGLREIAGVTGAHVMSPKGVPAVAEVLAEVPRR